MASDSDDELDEKKSIHSEEGDGDPRPDSDDELDLVPLQPGATQNRSASSSPLKRILIIALTFFFVALAYAINRHLKRIHDKPQIIYASRYSKEFKYRPAASPIITETLKDGRIRLRGAIPPEATPKPVPLPKLKKKRRTRRRKTAKRKGLS